jgi:periplasmic copper chaperone A
MRTGRRIGKLGGSVLAAGAVLLLAAAPAWGHVTVVAPGVSPGASDASITFRVPDESDAASTTGLRVQLPTDHPIAGVLVAPQPGWTAAVKQTKLATPIHTDDGDITEVVSEVDWTADAGGGIKPGFFGQFTIIAGKLPDGVSELTFKAVQQYSDGSTVSWIEQPAPGSSTEPEHPAPVLSLAGSSDSASASPTGSGSAVSVSSDHSDPASKSTATVGIVLGAIGVLLGAAALVLVLLRRRSPAG